MRSIAFLGCAVVLASVAAAVGCSSPSSDDDKTVGTNEQHATDAEIQLAQDAKDVISGKNAHCNQCHTASRSDVRRWADNMFNVAYSCFNNPPLGPADQVACMSDDKNNPQATFSPARLGLFAAGGALLQDTFMKADPTGARWSAFQNAAMPAGDGVPAMTADEFQKVVNWVFRGMPGFNEVFGGPPEPEECVPSITPELQQHVAAMRTQGWGAKLADQATPMWGCGAETDAKECMKSLPAVTEPWAAPGVEQTMRVLRDLPRTSYWVRSSADGRFVGYGQFTSAAVIDLNKPAGTPPIQVDARYDPAFFPNNDGVSFAGTDLSSNTPGPIKVCKQSALIAAANMQTPTLTLKEAGCTSIIDSVYQSVGASLDGAAFWMSNGAHVNDDGGNQITAPLDGFEQESITQLTPMVNDGIGFKPQKMIELSTPLEGDQIFSPSSQILITRFGAKPGHQGYTLRKITTKVDATTGAVTMDAKVVGKICGGGAKAMMSFDERYVVTHRYADPQPATTDGGKPVSHADIYVTDLVTGEVFPITHMGDNQYALYPHFRADGWLYFLVRDMNGTGKETLVATDVVLKRVPASTH
ncbi:MAG: hypothetical protein U0270_23975 [Labilithrix sp.]